jgi:hypothetical protein
MTLDRKEQGNEGNRPDSIAIPHVGISSFAGSKRVGS